MTHRTMVKTHGSTLGPKKWLALEVAASLVFAIAFFVIWPTNLIVDDAGIILRYMDNFARGYFFTYNPADGPVFGISSFIHGLLSGMLSYSHILSPLDSLFASNFLGLFLSSLFSFRILEYYTRDHRLIFPLWLLLMLSSPQFVANAKQGLETPLHLSILLLCFLLFLHGRSRLMWLSFALAVVSKLDALPIVVALAAAFLAKDYFEKGVSLSSSGRMAREFAAYALLPGAAWIVFSYTVFGSPMPQSAYSKFYYHPHPSGQWFPFLQPLIGHPWNKLVLIIMLVLWTGYALYSLAAKRKHERIPVLIYGLSLFAYLALYCTYNPGERHPWYYVVPEFLIRLQIIVILCVLVEKLPRGFKISATYAFVLVFAYFSRPVVMGTVMSTLNYLSIVETERMAIGQWVKDNSRADDVLLAGHGHIAREAGLYTVDYSGINSKIATDYGLDFQEMVTEIKPEWIVRQGLMAPDLQATQGYALAKSFYNIVLLGSPPWRVYEKVNAEDALTVAQLLPDVTSTDGTVQSSGGFLAITGTTIRFEGFPLDGQPSQFVVGLVKDDTALSLKVSIHGRDQSLLREEELVLDAKDLTNPVQGFTGEWIVSLDPTWAIIGSITLTAHDLETGKPQPVEVIDPMLLVKANGPTMDRKE